MALHDSFFHHEEERSAILSVRIALGDLDWLGGLARKDQIKMRSRCGRESGTNVEVGHCSVPVALDEVGEGGAEDGGEKSRCEEELHCWSTSLFERIVCRSVEWWIRTGGKG